MFVSVSQTTSVMIVERAVQVIMVNPIQLVGNKVDFQLDDSDSNTTSMMLVTE